MGGSGEEVKGLYGGGFIVPFQEEGGDVAGLGRGVTREVDDFFGQNFEEAVEEFFIAAGARRVENDNLVGFDKV